MTLAKEIVKERKRQGKSLRDLADSLKLSRMVVFNVERERSTLATSIRVAKALGIRGKRLMDLAQSEVAAMVRAA